MDPVKGGGKSSSKVGPLKIMGAPDATYKSKGKMPKSKKRGMKKSAK